MLWGLYTLGFDREANDFFYFLADLAEENPDLQIMYGIGGERELTEKTLDHLTGYDGARPVRIGNGAWDQAQHDVWGVLLDSVYLHVRSGERLDERLWRMLKHQVQAALENWEKPNQGLWEVRGPAQHFTASKVLCWVAADRGAKLAELHGDLDRAAEWRTAAEVIHADVCANRTDDRGVFCQHYDTTALDASNLLLLLLGFLPPEDPRIRATVLAIADELTEDELVLRYHVEETDDGFSGEKGTFTICSFYGVPPPGEERLVLGHESRGEVIDAPGDSGLAPGDRVAGVVRRPDPVPCPACAADEWDMCRNGGFVERGIKDRHGYGSERFRADPRFLIKLNPALGDLGVLLEPASVLSKAWEHAERIGARAWFEPRVALITGAGPIGLLAALLARQRGLETRVVDVVTGGAKPGLVADLGAEYHATPVAEVPVVPDVVIECTGLGEVAIAVARLAAPGGVVALTGISHSQHVTQVSPDAMNSALVLGNKAVFGTVNAARRHYDQAADALAQANPAWLGQLITRRLAPEDWPDALTKRPEDIKAVVDMAAAAG